MPFRLLAALILVPAILNGQQPPAPGCTATEHRQFDFWIGEWQVTDSAGTTVYGSNVITSQEAGCVLRERWTGARGGTGQSMNFFDRRTGQWHQVWVPSGGNVLRLSGGLQGERMVLEGDGVSPSGTSVRNRISWIPQTDGRVRQLWSISSDDGASWQPSFDGWYARRTP